MLQAAAKIFGFVFLLIGVLGFVPALTPDGHLLGIFEVGGIHNIIHLLSGVAALATGYSSPAASRLYFQIFGVVYALVALLGFVYGDKALFGIVEHNMADTFLHVVIAGTALYFGFASKPEPVRNKEV
jgi:preprotein translocase subunit Sss1